MDIEYINSNIGNPELFVTEIKALHNPSFNVTDYKQYDTKNHIVNDKAQRQDKTIKIPMEDGTKDSEGEPVMYSKIEKVNRISLAWQKLITTIATSFATGGSVDLKAKTSDAEKPMLEKVQEVWKKNKLDYKNNEIVKAIYSETEVAEIWFTEKKGNTIDTVNLKSNIYKPSDGFELIPVFDTTRDMIGFGLSYVVIVDKKEVEKLDFYTIGKLVKYSKDEKTWVIENLIPLIFDKIPVIYYRVKDAIWKDVQQVIDRLEILMSNFGDTNDYNGSPILFAEGEIKGFSAKGETGKVIEGENDAKLSYVSWDSAPESIKLEIVTLLDFLHTTTQTPDLSFKTMVNLGNVSGIAMDRIMTGAHLKARDLHNGVYGEGIQRRLNFIVSALASIFDELKVGETLNITPQFNLFRIGDEYDKITNNLLANGNLPLVSHLESIQRAGLSENPEETLRLIEENMAKNVVTTGNNANNVPTNL